MINFIKNLIKSRENKILREMNELKEKIEDRAFINSCVLYRNGHPVLTLSPYLAVKQNLTGEDIDRLKLLHLIRINMFEIVDMETDVQKQRSWIPLLECLEFIMQKTWGFEQDRNKHSWWFQMPHCTCCEEDNWELWKRGGERIIDENCPLHGDK